MVLPQSASEATRIVIKYQLRVKINSRVFNCKLDNKNIFASPYTCVHKLSCNFICWEKFNFDIKLTPPPPPPVMTYYYLELDFVGQAAEKH